MKLHIYGKGILCCVMLVGEVMVVGEVINEVVLDSEGAMKG